ncbi:MAG: aminoacyl-tRNA hydrolase [Planctomycetota bacterium]|jgi:PTH1 family peptidyl-tRNA hydrolase|nr:aminoacyl-tRNA hydrolase [Planctomycetota bacterium]MDP7130675.1 aminoacyl-tRNA hydrolase [Planctomycetota bacterium]MDP7249523.1 aminoacyl-tRNA hydrolase [Planctomycetota bacterium]
MKIVFGLGNPGREYTSTRHNVGFMAVERLAAEHSCHLNESRFRSITGEAIIRGQPVLLAMPQTYMNRCGPALEEILEAFSEPPESSLIITDDFHLPLGRIRIRKRGSSGGHNGLKSIEESLGTREFPRLKIGIGGIAEEEPIEFVLGEFSEAELTEVQAAVQLASQAAQTWIESGIEEAMNFYNRKDLTQSNE